MSSTVPEFEQSVVIFLRSSEENFILTTKDLKIAHNLYELI